MFFERLDDEALWRLVEEQPPGSCLFRMLLQSGTSKRWSLSSRGRREVDEMVEAGITLRAQWPRPWGESLTGWFGKRLYLSYAATFSSASKHTSVVSSAVGRDGQLLPQWPKLIDLALQGIARRGTRLLLVPGTTTYAWSQNVVRFSAIQSLSVEPSKLLSVVKWLDVCLLELSGSSEAKQRMRERLLLSPDFSAEHQGDRTPLQDKVAIGLSDSVVALSARPGGTIARLLHRRLNEPMFPIGSVFLALRAHKAQQENKIQRANEDWLRRGAVGWYIIDRPSRPTVESLLCKPVNLRVDPKPHVQQWCAPLPTVWRQWGARMDWPWLTHCTRGNAGPLPEESEVGFHQRVWLAGEQAQAHPLLTLMRICHDGRLKGASKMTRTDERCISFSAVPVVELLSRRMFRAHLGRWDWEPYGVLVRRDALRRLGAQPVVYRPDSEYAELPPAMQPFFQPTTTSKRGAEAAMPNDWSQECEWRMLGDLEINHLPAGALVFFVRTRTEAFQLSRCAPWPVFWSEGS